ncbi:MAG: S8 family serine peptidase [Candidatus Solibacter usitatus]|nr:S8 family serine peptidase [Candidatus Solibacter usitatus]
MMRSWVLWIALPLAASAADIPGRYIVELSDRPAAVRLAGRQRRMVRDDEMATHRAQVRFAQQTMRTAVSVEGGEVLGSVDTVANALFVRMSAQAAQRLAGLPGVLRVRPERTFKLLLDRAVVVDKVIDAWTLVGVDHAGLGAKIGIIDTGIDNTHPGFHDPSLPVPAGFPKVNTAADTPFTNHKVIVARSYANLFSSFDPDTSARDHSGHGTAVAMTAAGVLTAGPKATIRGVAPKAYLGSYKVFGTPGFNDGAAESAILSAIDDAVADGMDVINMSLGDNLPSLLSNDSEVLALDNAASMGVIVVVAAGNSGPDLHTVSTPATSLSAIAVGATVNDRAFSATATVGGSQFLATPGSGPAPPAPITAPVKDVASIQSDGLACSPFSPGSLTGKIALILRGVCFFSQKIANVAAGGAVGALVYTNANQPDAIVMEAAPATLPATMVSYADGVRIKQLVAATPGVVGTLDFELKATFVNPHRLADFSSKGPNVDGSIKPDLVAVGKDIYSAEQSFDPNGDVFNASGYGSVDGTSFASPMVAGGAAVVKAARPGLLAAQYRSLLINTAAPAFSVPGVPARIQEAGAGQLDLAAALTATSTAVPASLAFGIGPGDVEVTRHLTISNVGSTTENFVLSIDPHEGISGFIAPGSRTAEAIAQSLPTPGRRPVLSPSSGAVTLAPGESAPLTVTLSGTGLGPGAHEGFLRITGTSSGLETRVPYWYGVPSGTPVNITVLDSLDGRLAGTFVPEAILFRVTDGAGITAPTTPHAKVISGGGSVTGVVSLNLVYPGVYGISVRLGTTPGANVFRITAGTQTQDVTLTSQ